MLSIIKLISNINKSWTFWNVLVPYPIQFFGNIRLIQCFKTRKQFCRYFGKIYIFRTVLSNRSDLEGSFVNFCILLSREDQQDCLLPSLLPHLHLWGRSQARIPRNPHCSPSTRRRPSWSCNHPQGLNNFLIFLY